MPNACQRHHLHWLGTHYLTKASSEISAPSPKDFWSKGGKSAKSAQTMPNHAN